MTRFTYTARRKSGEKVSGTVDADNRTEAIRKIEGMGCVPVSLHAANQTPPPPQVQKQGTPENTVAILVGVGCLVGVFAVISAFWPETSRTPQAVRQAPEPAVRPAPEPDERTRTYAPEPKQDFSAIMAQSIRDSVAESRRTAELTQPRSDFPNVLSVLGVLYEGEGVLDTGKYSRDQQEQVFADRFKDKQYFVYGQITDVGTTAFGGRKYITVMVTEGHYFDVYPSDDFDLLAYAKGQRIGFVGTWTSLGTGILVEHKIEQAVSPDSATRGQVASATPRGPTAPYDQQSFVQQLREQQRQYREVQKLNNDLRLKDVAETASSFMEAARDISGWVAKAKGVNSGLFGTIWVDADFDGVQYSLYPSDTTDSTGSALLASLKMINKGDWIQFTGRMTGSTRLTKTGAVLDPAMHVVLTSVQTINP